MENAGLTVECVVTREDGSLAQRITFTQNGLTYARLLELQAKVVLPCVGAVMSTIAGWDDEAGKKVASGTT